MKFYCSLNKWKTQKKSVKIILYIRPDDIPENLYRFEDKPLEINFNNLLEIDGEIKNIEQLASGTIKIIISADKDYKKELIMYGPELKKENTFNIELLVDEEEQLKKLNQISGDQRAKAYATIGDIADSLGYEKKDAKKLLKEKFLEVFEYDSISLADCSKTMASEFIDFSIRLGYEMGVEWKDHPRSRMDSLEKWLRMCLDQKICAVCGKQGRLYVIEDNNTIVHEHHSDAVGMGRDRNKIDDSKLRKASLCAIHHSESHNMGWESFKKKYHIEGIIYNNGG